jgi:mitochondrial fission protein ELM1
MAAPLAIVALRSHRAGENGQIEALAAALSQHLGAPLEILTPRWRLPQANILSLRHQVSEQGAARLALPSAQRHLIISAALRNEALARALAQQSPEGMTVFLGRTWAPPDAFSLTVTTPQYRRPAHPKVLENPLTLHGLNESALDAARKAEDGPPLAEAGEALGVLIGGPSGPYTLGPKSARRLLAEAQTLAGDRALWVTTSPRTPAAAVKRLAAHPWRPQDRFLPWGSGPNPYRAILARAGALMVTGDSIAMLSEALGTGKAVRVFDLGDMAQRGSGRPRDRSVQSLAYSALFHLGPQRLSRDLRCVFEGLRDEPQFAFSPTPIPSEAWGQGTPAAPQLEATLARITALLRS